jgi:hypothetical protein
MTDYQTATGAPTADEVLATEQSAPTQGADAPTATDPLAAFDAESLRRFAAAADALIPAAHGMPSAADVVGPERLRFVFTARPDMVEPVLAALRPELGVDPQARLAALADEPTNLGALQLAVVGGYYTDRRVRELIGYPGQMAIEVRSWEYPVYLEEGLIDQVLARGPVWRDPETGQRAVASEAPRTYAERAWTQGGNDGRDRA